MQEIHVHEGDKVLVQYLNWGNYGVVGYLQILKRAIIDLVFVTVSISILSLDDNAHYELYTFLWYMKVSFGNQK